MTKYKSDILFFGSLIAIIVISYFLASILLPFYIGLALAYLFNPIIKGIQKLVKNRTLAVAIFLITILLAIGSVIFLLAAQISHDFRRLNNDPFLAGPVFFGYADPHLPFPSAGG